MVDRHADHLSAYGTKFFSWVSFSSIYLKKRFKALKVLKICQKLFFAFKIPACLPSNTSRSSRGQSRDMLCDVTTLSPHSRQCGGEGEESQMREKKRCFSRQTELVVVISAQRAKSSALVTYWPPAMSSWVHRICEQARACLRPVHFSIFIWKSGFTLDPSGYIKDMKTKKR